MIKRWLAGVCVTFLAVQAVAQDPKAAHVAERFKSMYPNTSFTAVRPAPIPGMYEVVMGENIAYADESGRYFVFGHLFDMQTQQDLTAQRKRADKKTEFPAAHLDQAIKTVKGDGSRVLAVFSDPDCPYCRVLERELAKLDNVTIYTFLYPLAGLHPEAKTKAISVWCAPDRAKAWAALMADGVKPALKACPNPVADNLALGSRLGVTGTPTLIASDGRLMPGAAPAERIDQWLNMGRLAVQQGGRP